MAVTFVIGNMNQLNSPSLFEAANSITSALANEFAEAGPGSAPGLADLPRAWCSSSSRSSCWHSSKLLLSRLKRNEGRRS